MDDKTTKLLKMLLTCGFAVGEVYSVRYLYESGIKPWYKWNMIVALGLGAIDTVKKGFKSIEEFWECLDDEPAEEEAPEPEGT